MKRTAAVDSRPAVPVAESSIVDIAAVGIDVGIVAGSGTLLAAVVTVVVAAAAEQDTRAPPAALLW